MIKLSRHQILILHDQLIHETGGTSGLRDEGMLDSVSSEIISISSSLHIPLLSVSSPLLLYRTLCRS